MDIVMRIVGGLVMLFVLYMSMSEIYKAICKRRESKKKYKVILTTDHGTIRVDNPI